MFGNAAPAVSSGTTALRAPPAIGMPNAPAANAASQGGLGFMGGGMMAGAMGTGKANLAQYGMAPPTAAQQQASNVMQAQSRAIPSVNPLGNIPQGLLGIPGPQNLGTSFNGMTGAQTNPGMAAAVGKIFQGLHPQTAQALRAIPRDTMMQLHQAGLIHPGLMGHMYGDRR